MERLPLGRSGIEVSRVGFGCDAMGGHSWGESSEDELVDAVHAALDRGVNFFDTADVYGLGRSETLLGRALRGRRDRAVIATKFGVRREGDRTRYDNSPAWIREALEASLRRLATDYVDLYQLHYWDGVTPLAAAVGVLDELRAAGKIRAYGVTNVDIDGKLPPGLSDGFVSFSNEYSLARREHEPLAERLHRGFGLTFLSWGTLAQGVLSGKYGREPGLADGDRRHRDVYVNFHGEKLERNLALVDGLRRLSAGYGKTVGQLAIRWVLDRLPFSVALVGAKRRAQAEENAGALGWSLRAGDVRGLAS